MQHYSYNMPSKICIKKKLYVMTQKQMKCIANVNDISLITGNLYKQAFIIIGSNQIK